jgi:hypothetical protein
MGPVFHRAGAAYRRILPVPIAGVLHTRRAVTGSSETRARPLGVCSRVALAPLRCVGYGAAPAPRHVEKRRHIRATTDHTIQVVFRLVFALIKTEY